MRTLTNQLSYPLFVQAALLNLCQTNKFKILFEETPCYSQGEQRELCGPISTKQWRKFHFSTSSLITLPWQALELGHLIVCSLPRVKVQSLHSAFVGMGDGESRFILQYLARVDLLLSKCFLFFVFYLVTLPFSCYLNQKEQDIVGEKLFSLSIKNKGPSSYALPKYSKPYCRRSSLGRHCLA